MQQEIIDSLVPSSMIIFTPPQNKTSIHNKKSDESLFLTGSKNFTHENIKSKKKYHYEWEDVVINHYNNQTLDLFKFQNVNELKQKLSEVIATADNQLSPVLKTQQQETSPPKNERKSLIEDIQDQIGDFENKIPGESFKKDKYFLKDKIDKNNKNQTIKQAELNIKTVKESNSSFQINGQYYSSKYAICNWKGQQSVLLLLVNDSVERRNQQLEKMNAYKDKLLATVSHDLKTPLNSIISIADFLYNDIVQNSNTTIISEENNSSNNSIQTTQSTNLEVPSFNQLSTKNRNHKNLLKKSFKHFKTEEYDKLQSSSNQKYLKIIYNNSMMLLNMINDILDYSQLNYSNLRKIKLNITKFDIQELVQEVYDIFQFQASAKNIQMLCTNNEKLNQIFIYSDRNRIKQLLMNFISNAMKFTLEGFIKVHFSLFPDCKGKLGISIQDTGVGIPPNIQAKLFKEYGTFNQYNLNSNGIGLGLVICKQFLEVLGDNNYIRIESQEGQGSCFYFEVNTDLRQNKSTSDPIHKFPGQIIISSSINNDILQNTYSPKVTSMKLNNVDLLTESQDQLNQIKTSIFSQEYNNQNDVQNLCKDTQLKKFKYMEKSTLEEIDQKIFINTTQTKASVFLRESTQFLKKSFTKEIETKDIESKQLLQFMIVDDSQFNLFSLKIHLKEYSHDIQIDEFLDVRKALEALKNKHYDVIFTDIQMPIMNGIQFVQEIRNMQKQIVQPQVVLVSAGHESIYEKEIKSLNIYAFINKPIVDKKTFKLLISNILNKQKDKCNKVQC